MQWAFYRLLPKKSQNLHWLRPKWAAIPVRAQQLWNLSKNLENSLRKKKKMTLARKQLLMLPRIWLWRTVLVTEQVEIGYWCTSNTNCSYEVSNLIIGVLCLKGLIFVLLTDCADQVEFHTGFEGSLYLQPMVRYAIEFDGFPVWIPRSLCVAEEASYQHCFLETCTEVWSNLVEINGDLNLRH